MSGPPPIRWLVAAFLIAAAPALTQTPSGSSFSPSSTAGQNAESDREAISIPATTSPVPPKLTPEQNGDLCRLRRQYIAAIDSYRRIDNPSAEVLNKIGICYQQMSAVGEALRYFRAALKLDPKNPQYLNNLATAQEQMRDYAAAEANYRKSLEYDPRSAVARKNLGTNLLIQHKYAEGNELYEQALAIDPHIFEISPGPMVFTPSPESERGVSAYFKARSCARAHLFQCAIDYLTKAFNQGSATIRNVAEEADFDSVRNTPAFKNLLDRQRE